MSATSFPYGVGEAILERVPLPGREVPASSADLTMADLPPHCKFNRNHWRGGEGGAAAGDALSGLVKNWLQPPSHKDEWEEDKSL